MCFSLNLIEDSLICITVLCYLLLQTSECVFGEWYIRIYMRKMLLHHAQENLCAHSRWKL